MDDKNYDWNEDVREFSSNTTFHGVRLLCGKVFFIRRILWIILLLLSSGIFVYMLTDLMVLYTRYTSTISMATENDHSGLALPVLTVCNINYISKRKLKQWYPELMGFYSVLSTNMSQVPHQLSFDTAVSTMKNVSMKELFEKVSTGAAETFVECVDSNMFYFNCSDYVYSHLIERGVCHSFNSGQGNVPLIQRNNPGLSYGIRLTLDARTHDYLAAWQLGEGFLAIIHDQEIFPRPTVKGFYVSPGQEVHVSLSKKITKILSKPYSSKDCVTEEDIENLQPQRRYSWSGYSQEECETHCFFDYLSPEYCTLMPTKYINTSKPPCSVFTGMVSEYYKYTEIYKNGLECNCLPRCVKTEYDQTITSTRFPSQKVPSYAKAHGWPLTEADEISSRYVQIQLYYETMDYTVLQQQPGMSFSDLFSNIGGQMALYLGGSIISLVEVFDFMILMAIKYCPCSRKQRKSRVTKIQIMPQSTK